MRTTTFSSKIFALPRASLLAGAVLLSSGGFAACGDATVEGTAADAGKSDGATKGDGAVKVETAFARNCAICHGDDGQGTSSAPQIQNPVVGYATWVVRNGRASTMGFTGAMPVATEAAVPQRELDEIFAFLGQFPHPTDGEGLYVRFCGNCHGADAKGGATGESLFKAAAKDADVISMVRKGHNGTTYSDRKRYMPSWTADEISDAEVKLIAAHVRSLPH